MTTMNAHFGIVDEVTYGTPLTVTRFYEFDSETVRPQQGRVQSGAIRSGDRVLRADRTEPFRRGAAGRVRMPVPTKGFGLVLKHMMGAISVGAAVDANYTQTATLASLLGDSFTGQFNRPLNPSGASQPFTYHGGKITDWTLACDVDGHLMADLGMDFEDEDTSTALATPSYPADFRLFTFAGATLTFAAAQLEVTRVSVSMDNALKTDRRYLRGSSLKKEPVENGRRTIEWACTADFASLTERNRWTSTTRAGMFAALVATFDGPIAHAGATVPRLEITLPACRFDDVSGANVSGPAALSQELTGVALLDTSAISITYRTSDATS